MCTFYVLSLFDSKVFEIRLCRCKYFVKPPRNRKQRFVHLGDVLDGEAGALGSEASADGSNGPSVSNSASASLASSSRPSAKESRKRGRGNVKTGCTVQANVRFVARNNGYRISKFVGQHHEHPFVLAKRLKIEPNVCQRCKKEVKAELDSSGSGKRELGRSETGASRGNSGGEMMMLMDRPAFDTVWTKHVPLFREFKLSPPAITGLLLAVSSIFF